MCTATVWNCKKLRWSLAAVFASNNCRIWQEADLFIWCCCFPLIQGNTGPRSSVWVRFWKSWLISFFEWFPATINWPQSRSSTEAAFPRLIREKIQATELEVEVNLIVLTISLVIEWCRSHPWFVLETLEQLICHFRSKSAHFWLLITPNIWRQEKLKKFFCAISDHMRHYCRQHSRQIEISGLFVRSGQAALRRC